MTANNVGFQEVVDLASHLSPEERLRLVAWIGAGLNATPAESANENSPPGSATAVLRAVHESPHLSAEDVDEWEQMIAAGNAHEVAERVKARLADVATRLPPGAAGRNNRMAERTFSGKVASPNNSSLRVSESRSPLAVTASCLPVRCTLTNS